MTWHIATRYERATERVERYTRELAEHVHQCGQCRHLRESRAVVQGHDEVRMIGQCPEGFTLRCAVKRAERHLRSLPLVQGDDASE